MPTSSRSSAPTKIYDGEYVDSVLFALVAEDLASA
jgi:hypothetical protein